MESRVPTLTVCVRPGDLHILMTAARKAIDLGKIDTEGEEFEIQASIGAIERALTKAAQEAA